MNDETKKRLEKFEWRVSLQRATMVFEQAWALVQLPLIVVGLFVIAVASGLILQLDAQQRIATFVAFGLLLLWSLLPVLKFMMPSRHEAMRRMEREADLQHRRVSSSEEKLATEFESDEAREIWAEHKRRQLAELEHVPVSAPKSLWRMVDPMALRVPVALGAAASLLLGTGDFSTGLRNAVVIEQPVSLTPVTVDAWIKPPGYTGKPPVLLTSTAMKSKLAANPVTEIPVNSVLSLRANNAGEASLRLKDELGAEIKDLAIKSAKSESGFSAETTVSRAMVVELVSDGKVIESFNFKTIADTIPTITIPKAPETGERGALTLNWEVKDDYGVKTITSDIALSDEQANGEGFEGNGVFLWDAPKYDIRLKRPNAKDEKGKTTQDLTAHPWAGLVVDMQVTATDAAGQQGKATPLRLTLPERPFNRPLSKALIEQRKALILVPDKAPDVAELFDLVLTYPKGLTERSGYLVRLAAISSRLKNSGDYDDVKLAIDDLWQLAVDIDEGSLADARAELKAIKEELERAIREGAPPEKIAELSKRMREAMNRLMEQMQAERDKRQKDGPQRDQQQAGQQNPITQEQLQKMLEAIEELSKSGAQEQAQALLDELDRILQNLEMGEGQQAGDGGQMQDMMDQLGEMMKRQQELMDDTQRLGQNGEQGPEGQQGEGQQGEGRDPGQQGQMGQGEGQKGQQGKGRKGRGQRGREGLAQEQGELGEMLDKMMKELGKDAPGRFGDAQRGMKGAEKNLRGGQRDGALQDQGDAMQALREGAGELGRRMREQARRGQGQGGRDGNRDGEAAGRNNDPLGRPRATRNPDDGPDEDIVPTEQALRRAREILDMLRSRANEGNLSDTERGYIDRLLKGLY